MDALHDVAGGGQGQIGKPVASSTGSTRGAPAAHTTHEVFNQPPPLVGLNLFEQDLALVEGIRREQAGWSEEHLRVVGQSAGSATALRWGIDANASVPVLH